MTANPYQSRPTKRDRLEQDIARGVPNHQLMRIHGVSYEQLQNTLDRMSARPLPPVAKRGPKPAACGTEAAWKRHREHGEGCDECASEHTKVLARRAESRARAAVIKRYRGVA